MARHQGHMFYITLYRVRKLNFQSTVGWNQVNYTRITTTHVCFIALTLAMSLRRCLNTQPYGLGFKKLPLDTVIYMYDPYSRLSTDYFILIN